MEKYFKDKLKAEQKRHSDFKEKTVTKMTRENLHTSSCCLKETN